MLENWCSVSGYEGYYEVSDLGHVRSIDHRVKQWNGGSGTTRIFPGRMLKPWGAGKYADYLMVQFSKENHLTKHYVHHLVMQAFGIPKPEHCEINHLDGNKANNMASNLEWISHADNVRHWRANRH